MNVNSIGVSNFKMEEESLGNWEWREEEALSLGNQREDLLGSSQNYDSN